MINLRILEHCENGSPVKPWGQAQIGLWFLVLQWAPTPHVFGHGSAHFWFIQARSIVHSEFTIHSGLHCGGVPIKLCWHEQTGCSFIFLQLLFGPHGDGTQGFSL